MLEGFHPEALPQDPQETGSWRRDYIKDAIELIVKLIPNRVGRLLRDGQNQYVIPDFILTNTNGSARSLFEFTQRPGTHISRSYADMFKALRQERQRRTRRWKAVTFVEAEAGLPRNGLSMPSNNASIPWCARCEAIIDFQYDYFLEGDETKLHPMILKDIAERINMDISTVSGSQQQDIQTDWNFSLKFFSEVSALIPVRR